MIFVLDATNKALKFTVSAGTDVHFTSHWADATTSGLTEGQTQGTSNGSTAVDAVPAPAASTRRVVKLITFHNTSTTTSRTVTLVNDVGGTSRTIAVFTLAPLATWYSDTAATTAVADGDKGDITVSGSGATWTIDNGVVTTAKILDANVTFAKMVNITSGNILGRTGAGSGPVQEITPGTGVLAWLQTPTSANLAAAITDETGSGALVFGTSPTITNTLKIEGTIEAGATTATISPQIRFIGLAAGPFHSLEIRNATTGDLPLITVNSPSSNYGLSLAAKGSEAVTITGTELRVTNSASTIGGIVAARGGSATFGGGSLRMYERTSNGTNFWAWRAPDNITVSVEQELPDGYGVAGQALLTDGAGVMSWGNVQTFKNLLINGNMQIAQRGTSATALGPTNASSGYHTADRWRIEINQLGANGQYTQSVASGAGDYPPDTVFRKSLKMICTQAVSSPLAAAAQLRIEQRIESQNLAQVEIGNATAKPLTVSFWVKSNKTGLFVAELIDPNGSQQVSGTFTIAAANSWEMHVVTFPANPTGTIIANNNSYGLAVSFWLVAGSNFTSGTLQTTWANTAANRAAGFAAGSQITNLNDYLQITGVQLEIGSTASEFELISIDQLINQCQRYLPMFDARVSTSPLSDRFFGGTFSSTTVPVFNRSFIWYKYTVPPRTNPTAHVVSALSDFNIFDCGTNALTTVTALLQPGGGAYGIQASLLVAESGGATAFTDGAVAFMSPANGLAWLRFEGCEL